MQVIAAAAGGAGPSPGDKASELLSNVTGALGKAKELKLDFGITSLLQYNFAAQLALAVVSWGVLFTTLHQGVANGHPVITFPILCNLVGVLLSAFSAWMSFTYFMKVRLRRLHGAASRGTAGDRSGGLAACGRG